ncbi:MAG: type II secretion system protein [Christensenellales bacterium]
MKKNQGFTLAELSVAIAVGMIVMVMVFTMTMSINAYVKEKQVLNFVQNDIYLFEYHINALLERYQSADYSFSVGGENQSELIINNSSENDLIIYQNNSLYLNDERIEKFEYIESVVFDINKNLIRCNLSLKNNSSHTIILGKRL